MRKINFVEPGTNEWTNWKQKCKDESDRLIADHAAGLNRNITTLYKDQKEVYFDNSTNFYGKCAYCESLITSNQPGDVEHFRPKGRLTDQNNQLVLIDDGLGGTKPHPGYYWLAYNHTNLLPSCIDCNRPSRGNSGGVLIGKWDQFPVRGTNCSLVGTENTEEPLLINPILEDPDNHLEIDSLGILHGKDDRGEKCINLFGLNIRESLVEERKKTYQTVKNAARLYVIACALGGNDDSNLEEVKLYKEGKRPYSIAGRKAISDYKAANSAISEFLSN